MMADTPGPVTTETEDLREFFEERAAILEHGVGLPRPEAELEAARITAILARNRGYLQASLRAALAADYPLLLSQVPDRPGPVDALPLGTASIVITEAEIEAARKGRTLVSQGDFTGAPEVKP